MNLKHSFLQPQAPTAAPGGRPGGWGIGGCVRANLLDHVQVPGLEAGEDALDDHAKVSGHLATQDLNQLLQASDGHDWCVVTVILNTATKCSRVNKVFKFLLVF
jgi:hypothetical protein